ncbi:MAG: hypothetical protein M3373_04380 [Gemmatimonadota bacterium]|nr:hypothetical protein [Gemmatimonadota bacterium]
MGVGAALRDAVIGRTENVPEALLVRWPELHGARYRRGGLPPLLAGWCLGQRTVAAITLWRTIWLAPAARMSAELLLHELRHVHHFQASSTFPFQYLWQTLRRGYLRNRFEADARAFARERLCASIPDSCRGDV